MSRGRDGSINSNVNRCARCGHHHKELRFRAFKKPVVDDNGAGPVWTHWCICPRSQDPILLRVVETNQQETKTT